MASYGFSKGYLYCAFCSFFGLGLRQDINNGLSIFCSLQNHCWNGVYYFLGILFLETNFIELINLPAFNQSPSIALEFF
jgi:hypothetical protein